MRASCDGRARTEFITRAESGPRRPPFSLRTGKVTGKIIFSALLAGPRSNFARARKTIRRFPCRPEQQCASREQRMPGAERRPSRPCAILPPDAAERSDSESTARDGSEVIQESIARAQRGNFPSPACGGGGTLHGTDSQRGPPPYPPPQAGEGKNLCRARCHPSRLASLAPQDNVLGAARSSFRAPDVSLHCGACPERRVGSFSVRLSDRANVARPNASSWENVHRNFITSPASGNRNRSMPPR